MGAESWGVESYADAEERHAAEAAGTHDADRPDRRPVAIERHGERAEEPDDRGTEPAGDEQRLRSEAGKRLSELAKAARERKRAAAAAKGNA
jgi:hypothetical protein